MLLGSLLLAALGSAALLLAFVLDVNAGTDASREGEVITRRFYAAINEAVRTGDLLLLDSVLTEGNTGAGGLTGAESWCDLRCRVAALHQLAPDVGLVVDDVLVDGDRIAARLSVEGNDRPAFLGLPLADDLSPWGSDIRT